MEVETVLFYKDFYQAFFFVLEEDVRPAQHTDTKQSAHHKIWNTPFFGCRECSLDLVTECGRYDGNMIYLEHCL